MAIYTYDLPPDSDAEPCPYACGRVTEDAAGGPCEACWDATGPEADDVTEGDHG